MIYERGLMSQNHMSQSSIFGDAISLTDFHTAEAVKFGNTLKISYLCSVK